MMGWNMGLRYGYSIILAIFNREINALGRLTQLGIWHDNMFNYFNLSSDLMEPFRPLIDIYVLKLKKGYSNDMDLTKEIKHSILEILEQEVMLNGRNFKMPNSIKVYTKAVIQALDENDPSYLPVLTYV